MSLSQFYNSNIMFRKYYAKIASTNWNNVAIQHGMPTYVSLLTGFMLAGLCSHLIGLVLLANLKTANNIPLSFESNGYESNQPLATLSDYKPILYRNIFTGIDLTETTERRTTTELRVSDLPYKFTGVIFGGRAEYSLVLLEANMGTPKQSETFVLGDTLPEQAVIVDITRTRVYFERDGGREYLELEQEPLVIKRRSPGLKSDRRARQASSGEGTYREEGFEREGDDIKVTRQWIDRATTVDFSKTLQDAKASPNIVNGQVKGFVMTRIRPNSVYEKMGMKENDVIEAINGIELNDAARAIRTLESLRNDTSIELQMRRDGKVQTRQIQVK